MENFTLRKTILKSYSESQFLRDPAENVRRNLIRNKHHTVILLLAVLRLFYFGSLVVLDVVLSCILVIY